MLRSHLPADEQVAVAAIWRDHCQLNAVKVPRWVLSSIIMRDPDLLHRAHICILQAITTLKSLMLGS